MENNHMIFKSNIIKDKLLLHDAVKMEQFESKKEYTNYRKYHEELAGWYNNIECYLDTIIVGHENATIDEFIESISNLDLSIEQIDDLIGLKNNPLFKKAVGMSSIRNIEELEDYIIDNYEEYDTDDLDISNTGATFNYNGKKVKAVKTAEELGIEVANLAEKIHSLKEQDIITDMKAQEFQKLLFDIYEYYLSIANGEQLDFPKISDREYKNMEKESLYQNITMERQLINLIRRNKKEFKDIQDMQQEYYEKNKPRIK